jgi:hypothetical protein
MFEFENEQVGKVIAELIDGKWRVILQNGFEFTTTYLAEIEGTYYFVYFFEDLEENKDNEGDETIIIKRVLVPIPQQIYEEMQNEYKLLTGKKWE